MLERPKANMATAQVARPGAKATKVEKTYQMAYGENPKCYEMENQQPSSKTETVQRLDTKQPKWAEGIV